MKLSFFGAAPDTGNLGVSALCYATLIGINKFQPECQITVFDNGRGKRKSSIHTNDSKISFFRQGAIYSRRFYRPENIRLWRFLAMLGGLGNSGLQTIHTSDGILDISGGDSFTDLYGPRVFKSVIAPKLLALRQQKPLILLPQTYGPFNNPENRQIASEIVKKSKYAWARDKRSFEVLTDLLGESFDAERHKCGVDVAFGLPAVKPANLSHSLETFLRDSQTEIAGFNISGLIYNDPQNARDRFGFKADYNKVVVDLIKHFINKTDCRIALVPHVVTPEGHYESDIAACQNVLTRLDSDSRKRIAVVPAYENPCEIKWVIKQFDWFCGTRMHATIAALSSGVPVSAISYSPKTLGVFETCGQGQHVADPQQLDNDEMLDCLWKSWEGRAEAIKTYTSTLPATLTLAEKQIMSILHVIQ